MLVVTTAVRVIDGVHGHSADHRPRLAARRLRLVVGDAGLQQRLLGATAASDNADHGTSRGRNDELAARRQPDAGLAGLAVVRDDLREDAGGAGEVAAAASILLDIADVRTLGDLTDRQDVACVELGGLAAVDVLATEHALDGEELLRLAAEAVRVAELDLGDRGAAARLVLDLADDATEVSVALGVVKRAELSGTLAVLVVGRENGTRTTTRKTDTTTHANCED